jgi:hypothetical protein
MADPTLPPSQVPPKTAPPVNPPSGYSRRIKIYIGFCIAVVLFVGYSNRISWFPTYGLFSGENTYHSSFGHYYGYGYHSYGIHGK